MPHSTDIRTRVERLVDEALKESPFFCVEATVKGAARNPIISVYLDGDEGITIADCATISRDLHLRIEDAGLCPKGFELTVSSPGLERSLRLPRQYARHVGRNVRFEVSEEGQDRTVEGTLLGAADDVVRVEGESGEISFPVHAVKKAVVKVAW